MDVLGVAMPNQKHDGGGVGCAVVGQPRFPVGRKQFSAGDQLIHVSGQPQCHHVSGEAIDYGTRLLA